jgi:hypothetical protein
LEIWALKCDRDTEQSYTSYLEKKDMIVKSKTGSGKTAVFGVSMLQLTDPEADGPQGLILTPPVSLPFRWTATYARWQSIFPIKLSLYTASTA